MKIIAVTFVPLEIPFANEFSHAMMTRRCSDNFLIKITTNQGIIGFGEALVRPYVTGESINNVSDALQIIINRIWDINWRLGEFNQNPESLLLPTAQALDELFSILELTRPPNIIAYNGLRCALELAIIDALLRESQQSLSIILPPVKKEIIYSGIISAETHEKSLKIARHFKQLGICDYKIKITNNTDIHYIQEIRSIIGNSASLRLDANSDFSVEGAILLAKSIEHLDIAAIEQPIPRNLVGGLAKIQHSTSIPIMADESLITLDDADNLITEKAAAMFNVRLAKCGGIFKSMEIANLAKQHGLNIQLGCLVGETALLSAAGRHFSAHFKHCIYTEGSFGNLLLKEDISQQNIHLDLVLP